MGGLMSSKAPYIAGYSKVGRAPPSGIRSSVTGSVLGCISGRPSPWPPTVDVKEVGE